MTRKKLDTSALTETDIEAKVALLTTFTVEISQIQADQKSTVLEIEAELTKIRDQYQARLTDYQTRLSTKEAEYQALHDEVQAWAKDNKATFEKKRSIEYLRGTIGFALGNHRVQTLKKWTLPKVALAMLRRKLLKGYVEEKPVIKKDELIRDRDKLPKWLMKACGFEIVQADNFYFAPKLETSDALKGAK